MLLRKALIQDKYRCLEIYNSVCDWEAVNGKQTFWNIETYPNMETVETAISKNEMFVLENDNGVITACGIINQFQPEYYKNFKWKIIVSEDKVLVLHTFGVDPEFQRKGIGKTFMAEYEKLADKMNCSVLRLDTLVTNIKAQSMYKKLGFDVTGFYRDDPNGVGEFLTFIGLEKKL